MRKKPLLMNILKAFRIITFRKTIKNGEENRRRDKENEDNRQ